MTMIMIADGSSIEIDGNRILEIECNLLESVEKGLGNLWKEYNQHIEDDVKYQIGEKVYGNLDEYANKSKFARWVKDFIETNDSYYTYPDIEDANNYTSIIKTLNDNRFDDIILAYERVMVALTGMRMMDPNNSM